jgi:hypothetical protein
MATWKAFFINDFIEALMQDKGSSKKNNKEMGGKK